MSPERVLFAATRSMGYPIEEHLEFHIANESSAKILNEDEETFRATTDAMVFDTLILDTSGAHRHAETTRAELLVKSRYWNALLILDSYSVLDYHTDMTLRNVMSKQ